MIKTTKTKASFVEPMLLLRSETLPEGPEWMYELKLDGYRALAIKTRQRVRLRSRNNNDFTGKYPAIAKALERLPALKTRGEVHSRPAGEPSSSFAYQNWEFRPRSAVATVGVVIAEEPRMSVSR